MMVEPQRRETAETDFTSVNLNARSTVRVPASRIASSHFNGNFDATFDEEQKTLPEIRESRSSLRRSETKFFRKRTNTASNTKQSKHKRSSSDQKPMVNPFFAADFAEKRLTVFTIDVRNDTA